jgi:hypothetical protein
MKQLILVNQHLKAELANTLTYPDHEFVEPSPPEISIRSLMTMTIEGLTWDRLVELEPKLQQLFRLAQGSKLSIMGSGPESWLGPEGLKSQLLKLVGTQVSDNAPPLLKTREAYNLAHYKILKTFVKSLLGR